MPRNKRNSVSFNHMVDDDFIESKVDDEVPPTVPSVLASSKQTLQTTAATSPLLYSPISNSSVLTVVEPVQPPTLTSLKTKQFLDFASQFKNYKKKGGIRTLFQCVNCRTMDVLLCMIPEWKSANLDDINHMDAINRILLELSPVHPDELLHTLRNVKMQKGDLNYLTFCEFEAAFRKKLLLFNSATLPVREVSEIFINNMCNDLLKYQMSNLPLSSVKTFDEVVEFAHKVVKRLQEYQGVAKIEKSLRFKSNSLPVNETKPNNSNINLVTSGPNTDKHFENRHESYCWRCGNPGTSHNFMTCPKKNEISNKYAAKDARENSNKQRDNSRTYHNDRTNHKSSVKTKPPSNIAAISDDNAISSDTDSIAAVSSFHDTTTTSDDVNNVESTKRLKVVIPINIPILNSSFDSLLDTGADISLVSVGLFNRLVESGLQSYHVNHSAKLFDGKTVNFGDYIDISLSYFYK